MNSATQTPPARTDRVRGLLTAVLAESEQWLPSVRFAEERRWYRRLDISHLDGAGGFEAWLLSWLPGQRTGLHDHGGASGGFAVVTGTLREHCVAADRLSTITRAAGQPRAFGEHHIHEVVNASRRPAVSVHLYTPSLTTMTRYRWTRSGAEVTAIERAGSDW